VGKGRTFDQDVKEKGAIGAATAAIVSRINIRKVPDIIEWMADNKIVNEKDQRIEFHDHAFMLDIYRDFSPKIVATKCSQIGYTVANIIKASYAANEKDMHIIYTLPTDKMLERFTPVKINPIIEHNPALKNMCKLSTTHLKQFGKGFIHFQGTNTETEAISTTSDWNIHDEYDKSRLDIVSTFISRLSASAFRWQSWFSNPTFPENGVDTYWRISDQKHWFIWCDKCNHAQYLKWPESVANHDNPDAPHYYKCLKCGRPLTDDVRRQGQWVPKFPGRGISGYWINHMMCPWMPAEEVYLASQGKLQFKDVEGRLISGKAVFYNFILGLPYAGSEDRVDRSRLVAALKGKTNLRQNNVMGVDQGKKLNCTIGNSQGIYRLEELDEWEELDTLMEQEKIKLCVVDAQPETREAIKLAKRFPGKVFLCWYKDDPKGLEDVRWGDQGKEPKYEVKVARNRLIDSLVDKFTNGNLPICMRGDEPMMAKYYKHWEAVYRVQVADKYGNSRLVWANTGPDHFVHSTVYWEVAMTRISYYEAEDVEDTTAYEMEQEMRRRDLAAGKKEETFLEL
jgi:hypothetical protein